MNKRPLSITLISFLFIAVGGVALTYHLLPQHLSEYSSRGVLAWVCVVRALAVLSGAFMLLGHNWARWLLVLWIAFHVCISALHSFFEVAVHGLLFAIITYFLFRTDSSAFFHSRSVPSRPAMSGKDKETTLG